MQMFIVMPALLMFVNRNDTVSVEHYITNIKLFASINQKTFNIFCVIISQGLAGWTSGSIYAETIDSIYYTATDVDAIDSNIDVTNRIAQLNSFKYKLQDWIVSLLLLKQIQCFWVEMKGEINSIHLILKLYETLKMLQFYMEFQLIYIIFQ